MFALVLLCTSGCAILPPLVEQGSWVVSGLSYLSTGKGPADHAISMTVKQDCSLFRVLRLRKICVPVTSRTNRPLLVTLTDLLRRSPVSAPDAETPGARDPGMMGMFLEFPETIPLSGSD